MAGGTRALLDEAIEAQGGAQRWARVREVVIDNGPAGGLLIVSKLRRRALPPQRITVAARRPHAVFEPFFEPGRRGVFDGLADEVRIERDDGEVLERRTQPRSYFAGLRRQLHWDALDLLYFAGYAWSNYVRLPFLLAGEGFALSEIEPWREGSEKWRRLAVTFPPTVHTHSREQVLHIDERGLIRRHDYTAMAVGRWAHGAHCLHDHREFDGITIATRRRVHPRAPSGAARPGPVLVRLDVRDVRVVDG